MTSQVFDDLMSVLAAVVIADKRVFATEIQTFLDAAKQLQTTLKIEPQVSEAKTLLWYELNKDDIKENVMGPYFKTWLYERVDRLAHIEDKQAVLAAMNNISLADDEKHVSERALMVLTAYRWGLSAPPK